MYLFDLSEAKIKLSVNKFFLLVCVIAGLAGKNQVDTRIRKDYEPFNKIKLPLSRIFRRVSQIWNETLHKYNPGRYSGAGNDL